MFGSFGAAFPRGEGGLPVILNCSIWAFDGLRYIYLDMGGEVEGDRPAAFIWDLVSVQQSFTGI